jgi:electron transfer flavoprotein beta subunit
VETAGVKHSMNPFDELSIEESVRIREKKRYPHGVESITAFSLGPPKSVDILRTAMAMGADSSIHVEVKDGEEIEPLGVAKVLAKVNLHFHPVPLSLGLVSADTRRGVIKKTAVLTYVGNR